MKLNNFTRNARHGNSKNWSDVRSGTTLLLLEYAPDDTFLTLGKKCIGEKSYREQKTCV
jgi:hypothetical protein